MPSLFLNLVRPILDYATDASVPSLLAQLEIAEEKGLIKLNDAYYQALERTVTVIKREGRVTKQNLTELIGQMNIAVARIPFADRTPHTFSVTPIVFADTGADQTIKFTGAYPLAAQAGYQPKLEINGERYDYSSNVGGLEFVLPAKIFKDALSSWNNPKFAVPIAAVLHVPTNGVMFKGETLQHKVTLFAIPRLACLVRLYYFQDVDALEVAKERVVDTEAFYMKDKKHVNEYHLNASIDLPAGWEYKDGSLKISKFLERDILPTDLLEISNIKIHNSQLRFTIDRKEAVCPSKITVVYKQFQRKITRQFLDTYTENEINWGRNYPIGFIKPADKDFHKIQVIDWKGDGPVEYPPGGIDNDDFLIQRIGNILNFTPRMPTYISRLAPAPIAGAAKKNEEGGISEYLPSLKTTLQVAAGVVGVISAFVYFNPLGQAKPAAK